MDCKPWRDAGFAAAPWLGHSIVTWKTNIINPDSLKPESFQSHGTVKPAPACDSQILLPLTVCKPELAAQLGLTGLAGRASAQAWDARTQFPQAPYDRLDVNMATQRRGDVLARAEVRFAEVYESLRLIRGILKRLPAGGIRAPLQPVQAVCEGLGWVESWRGEVVVAVRIAADGTLDRVHPHDPSWQNWPLVEVGMLGNIVADFPLINKSFNLSYSGPDL